MKDIFKINFKNNVSNSEMKTVRHVCWSNHGRSCTYGKSPIFELGKNRKEIKDLFGSAKTRTFTFMSWMINILAIFQPMEKVGTYFKLVDLEREGSKA